MWRRKVKHQTSSLGTKIPLVFLPLKTEISVAVVFFHVFPARARRGAAAVVDPPPPSPQRRNPRRLCSGCKSLQQLKLPTKLRVHLQGDKCARKFVQNLLSCRRKIAGVGGDPPSDILRL